MLIALKRLQKFSLDPYFCLPVPVALCRRRMFVLKSTFFCGRDRTFDGVFPCLFLIPTSLKTSSVVIDLCIETKAHFSLISVTHSARSFPF